MKLEYFKTSLFCLIIKIFIFTCFFSISFTQALAIPQNNENELVFEKAIEILESKFYLNEKFDFISYKKKYKGKIKTKEEAYLVIKSVIKKLNDPYTRFLSNEEYTNEKNTINSKLTGIGIKLAHNKPLIVDVLPKSPAEKSGLKKYDFITLINKKSTKGLNSGELYSLLKGEKGSNIFLKIKRGKSQFEIALTREELNIIPVTGRLINNDIALIKINSFLPETTCEFAKAEINKYKSKNGIILDLRNNTGGLLKNAIQISDYFLSKGKIVSTVTSTGIKDLNANPDELFKGNLVVLVNENTASASEILVSALKENNRAIIIGTKTYGKGLIQEIIELPDKSALHVTVASFLSPNQKHINKIGISPNKVIKDENKQLALAKEIIESKLKNKELLVLN